MKEWNSKYKLAAVLIMSVFVLVACSQANNTAADNMMQTRETLREGPIDRSVSGLSSAKQSQIVELKENQIFQLNAMPVSKEINGIKVRMYGYNGQIPGPLIKAKQGSTIYANFTNNAEFETTVHWHGIRLENKFDGVPNVTQSPIKPGESFLYKINLPDEGVYWYHPHIREDLQQELGLYGNIFVEPKDENYFNKVDREEFIFLDDIKMARNDVDIFSKDFARFALMGRFGNLMLVNGETNYNLDVNEGDVVRLYITDSANTRMFNFSIESHKLKVIGSDSGKFEKEFFADSITIAPAERYIAEVLFDKQGTFKIIHKTPEKTYALGAITVGENSFNDDNNFLNLKINDEIKLGTEKFKKYINAKPDYEIDLTVESSSMQGMNGMMPMGGKEPIEWEDEMASMNAMSTSKNIKWILRDKKTGKENLDINYKVKLGEIKKIRFFNDPKSMHPMQHPIHLHGQRFLVLSEDGKQNENLGWKDTVLVPKGSTVDILVEFANPGEWMIHCHIAEHLEAGMMAQFTVV